MLRQGFDPSAYAYKVVLDVELTRNQHDAGAHEGKANSHQIPMIVPKGATEDGDPAENASVCAQFQNMLRVFFLT
jgi:hypothetical protein